MIYTLYYKTKKPFKTNDFCFIIIVLRPCISQTVRRTTQCYLYTTAMQRQYQTFEPYNFVDQRKLDLTTSELRK